MRILVTGGAGYIGAHVVRLLEETADEIVIVDDLKTGRRERLGDRDINVVDLAEPGSTELVASLCRDHRIDSIIHFAARKQVGESVEAPIWYFQQNVGSLANVLAAATEAGVSKFVFSSSAAVYGSPEVEMVTEETATLPVNPYGETKLVGEWLLSDVARATDLAVASLRYFNVAGAGWPELGDRAVLNLVPMVLERLDAGESPLIFGDDYATPDGTCVRDYIHVLDLARAHIAALQYLDGRVGENLVFNVGTGTGTSVGEMVEAILQVTGSSLRPEVRARRSGDPARVVASPGRINSELGWRAQYGLKEIVDSAWAAHCYFAQQTTEGGRV